MRLLDKLVGPYFLGHRIRVT